MKIFQTVFLALAISFLISCKKENILKSNPIVGEWDLTDIDDINIEDINCYNESYISSTGESIKFYILDRLENGTCETVLDETAELTAQDGAYFLGDDELDIVIDGNVLTWKVTTTTLLFRKQ